MGMFCVLRKQFLERVFRLDELAEMTEMLLQWYLIQSGKAGRSGTSRCEAIIFAFARPDCEAIRESIGRELPDAEFDVSDPDRLRILGTFRSAGDPPDLSVWRVVLGEPKLEHACVLLRLTIAGPVNGDVGDEGITTFVFCGAPATGAILVKAIWAMGLDESMQLVYRGTPWPQEKRLLKAFDLYRVQSAAGVAEIGAQLAYESFGREVRVLFSSRGNQRLARWLTRQFVEMPDDRGPKSLMRRVALPLLGGACLVAVAMAYSDSWSTVIVSGIGAACMFFLAARIVFAKGRRVVRYYKAMRSGLGKLHAGPMERKQIDLSNDTSPTLLKCSAEIAALGAVHLCDVSVTTARGVLDGNRYYTVSDATIAIGLLRKTEKYLFFPARPILLISTRFEDGRRHYTVGHAVHRKGSNPKVTRRCVLTDGGVGEMLAVHRRRIAKMVAEGAILVSPPSSPAELFQTMDQEREETRQAWKESPYSWGDALHHAFKVCRREYLVD